MTARLTSAMLVSALVRAVNNAGGAATVLAKGEASAGSILLIYVEKGIIQSVNERLMSAAGAYQWTPVGPDQPDERDAYLHRRQSFDPDLWLVELDIANAERFTAETG